MQAFRAYLELSALRDRAHLAQQQLQAPTSGRVRADELTGAARDVQQRLHRLSGLTHGVVWRTGDRLPGIGRPLSTVATLAAVGDQLGQSALPVGSAVAGDVLRGPRSGPLDVRPLTRRRVEVEAALAAVHRARVQVQDLDAGVPLAAQARARLAPGLAKAEVLLAQAAQLAALGGPLTGEQGPRRYLVVLESPAESRASGGLVGGFVELAVDHGAARVVREGTKHQLRNEAPGLRRLGGGFDATWEPYGVYERWQSSNISLDFPSVAALWRARYDLQYGGHLDGVLALTPEALSALLQLTGPLDLGEGYPVRAEQLAPLLEVGIYQRFPRNEDEDVRDAAQLRLLRRLVDAALRPLRLGPEVLDAARTLSRGGVRIASAHSAEQAWFTATSAGGALPRGPGPFVAWTTQSSGGSKLDPYLRRTLSYRRRPAGPGRDRVVAAVGLRNDAPARGLPAYVTLSPGHPVPPGTSQLLVATYLSPGATVSSVEVDGVPVIPRLGQEQGHPVVLLPVVLPPAGGHALVQVVAEEPASDAPVRTVRQPTVLPDVVHRAP